MYIKRPTTNQVIEIKEVLFLYIENFDIRQNTVLLPTAQTLAQFYWITDVYHSFYTIKIILEFILNNNFYHI